MVVRPYPMLASIERPVVLDLNASTQRLRLVLIVHVRSVGFFDAAVWARLVAVFLLLSQAKLGLVKGVGRVVACIYSRSRITCTANRRTFQIVASVVNYTAPTHANVVR